MARTNTPQNKNGGRTNISNYKSSKGSVKNASAKNANASAKNASGKTNPALSRVFIVLFGVLLVAALVIFLVNLPAKSSDIDDTGAVPVEPPRTARNAMERIVSADTIYDNISVNGVPVGGLTKQEAQGKLEQELTAPLSLKSIHISNMGDFHTFPYDYFEAAYNITRAVAEAHAFAREGSVEERYALIQSLVADPLDITAELIFSSTAVKAAVLSVENVGYPPRDATFYRENGQFYITPETPGRVVDVEATSLLVSDLIRAGESGVVEIILSELQPEYTTAVFAGSQDLLGAWKTSLTGSNEARDANISNSLSKINNHILFPGDVFSCIDIFGEMTFENGYRMANVITGGVYEEDMGGGVCQTSTTLYMAVMTAELEIVTRSNHSLKISYADYSFDAAIAGNYMDFKFKNNTDRPLLIEGYIEGREVIVNVYGHESRPANRTIKYSNQHIETIEPPDPVYVEDDTLPLGVEVEDESRPARQGYRYELHKTVFIDGVETESYSVNRSKYNETPVYIRVGTNPDMPIPEPDPQPDPDPDPQPDPQPDPDPLPDPDPQPDPDPDPQPPDDDWPEGIPRF